MTDTELTDEAVKAAKTELARSIAAYYAIVEPDTYVAAWVLATHKLSVELEQEGSTAVGVLVPTGQSFVTTRGILDVALSAGRESSA